MTANAPNSDDSPAAEGNGLTAGQPVERFAIPDFLRPRLVGSRFAGHAIPLEFLKDLAAIENMVFDVAKWRFLAAHPDRKRSPRGFADGVSLRLTGVEDGSAVPVISLVITANTLFAPDSQAYFVEARDAIIEAIRAAEAAAGAGPSVSAGSAIRRHLPERALGYFDRIGRSLRDGESVEFTAAGGGPPARLTRQTRRSLVFASASTEELTEEVEVRGAVTAVDLTQRSFTLQLDDGRRIAGPLPELHADAIVDGLTRFHVDGTRVVLNAVGRFGRTDRLERIVAVDRVRALDPLDVPTRLDELRSLLNGWLDGVGVAPPHSGLDWLGSAFDSGYADDLHLPYLYPTESGGIRAEWSFGSAEASLEIDLESRRAAWHLLRLDDDAEESRDLDLADQAAWSWLGDQVRTLAGEHG